MKEKLEMAQFYSTILYHIVNVFGSRGPFLESPAEVTFRARKAVLCLPGLHSRPKL